MILKENSKLQQMPPAKFLNWAAKWEEMVTYFCSIYTFYATAGTHSFVPVERAKCWMQNLPSRADSKNNTEVQAGSIGLEIGLCPQVELSVWNCEGLGRIGSGWAGEAGGTGEPSGDGKEGVKVLMGWCWYCFCLGEEEAECVGWEAPQNTVLLLSSTHRKHSSSLACLKLSHKHP